MDLKKINLNIYSYGYSAGFIKTAKVHEDKSYMIDLKGVLDIVKSNGLGGIEFPFDFFFKNDIEAGFKFISKLESLDLKWFVDFEEMDTKLLEMLIPRFYKLGKRSLRIKMDHVGEVFYGGNRFRSRTFRKSKNDFESKLEKLLPTLKKYNFKVLIENHQDLNSIELSEICEKIGTDFVGVNWDIGNSLSTGETLESFFERSSKYIGNVHIKDYQIAKVKNGFKLVRCAIGDGDISIGKWLKMLIKKDISMSIELGAQISRECEINNPSYFSEYTYSEDSVKSFLDFIHTASAKEGPEKTLFESEPLDWTEIVKNELAEVIKSIQYLRRSYE
jgi:3-oxoisoapionate decarboxylase